MSLLEKTLKAMEKPEKAKPPEGVKPPPKAPKIPREKSTGDINIDYEWTAKNSSFQTFMVEFIKHHFPNQFKGVNTRTTGKAMANQFNKKLKEVNKTLDFVEVLKSGKKGDYSGVMREFKELLKKREERLENGTD